METMKIILSLYQPIEGLYHLDNNGQITGFNGVELTISGCIALNLNGRHISLLDTTLAKEATQLMIDNDIVITNEADKVAI
jgi:hypothetical protein